MISALKSYIDIVIENVISDMTFLNSQQSMFETHYHGIFLDEEELADPLVQKNPNFDFEKFKSITSFEDRIAYAKKYLSKLGQGSSRIALAVDSNTVIKIARNTKGIAQNKTEIDVGNIGYESIAEVKDYDKDGLWMEMERAQKFSVAKFKQATGFDFNEFLLALNYWYTMNMRGNRYYAPQPTANQSKIEDSELFSDLTTLIADFDMPVGDILRPSSWGIVKRNGRDVPVLIDFGLTADVYKQFYSR